VTGLLFLSDFSGFVHCLNSETGATYWTHDMRAHIWPGGTLVADGKVYLGDEDGDFVVLAAGKRKQIISECNLGAPIYSTPIVANGVLYVQSSTHLFAVQDLSLARATATEPRERQGEVFEGTFPRPASRTEPRTP